MKRGAVLGTLMSPAGPQVPNVTPDAGDLGTCGDMPCPQRNSSSEMLPETLGTLGTWFAVVTRVLDMGVVGRRTHKHPMMIFFLVFPDLTTRGNVLSPRGPPGVAPSMSPCPQHRHPPPEGPI